MTALAKRYLKLIHELDCVVCRHCYGKRQPAAEAHHVEAYRGQHSDFATVPLCLACHAELHRRHRRPFYLAHNIDDVKLLAWTADLVFQHMEGRKR